MDNNERIVLYVCATGGKPIPKDLARETFMHYLKNTPKEELAPFALRMARYLKQSGLAHQLRDFKQYLTENISNKNKPKKPS